MTNNDNICKGVKLFEDMKIKVAMENLVICLFHNLQCDLNEKIEALNQFHVECEKQLIRLN